MSRLAPIPKIAHVDLTGYKYYDPPLVYHSTVTVEVQDSLHEDFGGVSSWFANANSGEAVSKGSKYLILRLIQTTKKTL